MERGRTSISCLSHSHSLTRNGTSDLSVCRTAPNPLSHTSQGMGSNSEMTFSCELGLSQHNNHSKRMNGHNTTDVTLAFTLPIL